MLISRNWLQRFFDAPLPEPETLAQLLTTHSWEIDEVVHKPEFDDVVLDVKVLPDKSAWALSHRGVATEISAITGIPLTHDPLGKRDISLVASDSLSVSVDTEAVDRYILAKIEGVSIGPSPKWLQSLLLSLGQRSINNVVDATNYVLLSIGQPTHVFDADKMNGVRVRSAYEGERIHTLGGGEYTLTTQDTVIADSNTDVPLALAGVKGGVAAEVSDATRAIYIESAHFDAVRTRKTAGRHNLRTDASVRYENGVVSELARIGVRECVELILEIAGGTCVGYTEVTAENTPSKIQPASVSCTFEKLNSILGTEVPRDVVRDIFTKLTYAYTEDAYSFTIVPPFERTDLVIPEDLIEEVSRFYGESHIPAKLPEKVSLPNIHKGFYCMEKIRNTLVAQGFSEVYTSSFREKDIVPIKNALASDKGYLRSVLRENIKDALKKNAPHTDLLGVSEIRMFEIGTVFEEGREYISVAIGVCGVSGYSPKKHESILNDALVAVSSALGTTFDAVRSDKNDGVVEFSFTELVEKLPDHGTYDLYLPREIISYVPFSPYPSMSRDVSFWTPVTVSSERAEELIQSVLDSLCVRVTFVDEYRQDDKVSYAFRLVFQAGDRTLTDTEVNARAETVYEAIRGEGWTPR